MKPIFLFFLVNLCYAQFSLGQIKLREGKAKEYINKQPVKFSQYVVSDPFRVSSAIPPDYYVRHLGFFLPARAEITSGTCAADFQGG